MLAKAAAADAHLAAARAEGPAAVEALHPLLGIAVAGHSALEQRVRRH